MTKDAPNEWDTTANNNTDVGGINIAEGCPPSNVNNALRAIMAQVAAQFGILNVKGADIASATTTDLSTATGNAVDITGTTTITGLGTVAAGQVFILQFDGALTLTHNGTSLKLPGAVNITTAAGDIAVVVSEGSGNWRCVSYQRTSYPAPVITPFVEYTPTFTGFGTVSSVSVFSRRVGDCLQIRAKFVGGTPTTTEARMSLGFNGTDGSLTVDSTKVPTIRVMGTGGYSTSGTAIIFPQATGGDGYITFGLQAASSAALTNMNADSLLNNGVTMAFFCEVPITGW